MSTDTLPSPVISNVISEQLHEPIEVEYQELQAIASTEEEGWTYTFGLPFWRSKLVGRFAVECVAL